MASDFTTRVPAELTLQYGLTELHAVMFQPRRDDGGPLSMVILQVPECSWQQFRCGLAIARPLQAERGQVELELTINRRLVELGVGHIDAIRLARMRLSEALALCPTEADLRRLGQLRGYKPGFAWAVMQERRGRSRMAAA